jgi:crotonobetainyl-CoA:carnitine CoA-transferase CaiB-like acyl-CoA transferase
MLYTDRHWAAFLHQVGRGELVTDAKYATVAGRTAHIDEVYALVAEELGRKGTTDWLHILTAIDVPHEPVRSLAEVMEDPHLVATGAVHETEHPLEGRITTVRSPFLFDGARAADPAPAPALGQDTADFATAFADDEAGVRADKKSTA